jgi:TrmH family RNA methyltransferase
MAAAAAAARKTASSAANARLPIAIASASTLPTAAALIAPAATSSAAPRCKPAAIAARSAAKTVAAATFALAARRFAAAPAKHCDRLLVWRFVDKFPLSKPEAQGLQPLGFFIALDDDCVKAHSANCRMKITSTANPRVKAAAKLRNSAQRAEQGRFMINGVREIGRALDGGIALQEIYVCPEQCGDAECRELLGRLEKTGVAQFEVSAAVFSVLAYGSRMEGVVAIAEFPQRSLKSLKLSQPALVAVLERIEKPGNVGAVVRSADGAGISAVVVADAGSDLYNPNAIRASLGTIFTLPVCAASSAETIAWLREQMLRIFAARVDGAIDYTQCDFTGPCAFVLGSEAEGLSDAWRGDDVTSIRLPMRGAADSLNVSATAAVLFYEALRQRS